VAIGELLVCHLDIASFTLTEELYGAIPLEKVIRQEWNRPLSAEQLARKRLMIGKVTEKVRRLHHAGLFHQDLYLGHFLMCEDNTLYIIDVQRVQNARVVPGRYLIKDLAQLAFSAQVNGGLTSSVYLRFLKAYLGNGRPAARACDLIHCIMAKANRIDRHTVKLLARRRRRGEIP
jgi:heptose I phosphotransferase